MKQLQLEHGQQDCNTSYRRKSRLQKWRWKNESTGISLYKSWLGNDSQYLDLVGKFSHLKNEYKSYNVKNEKMEANYHTNAGTLSLEYGKDLLKITGMYSLIHK